VSDFFTSLLLTDDGRCVLQPLVFEEWNEPTEFSLFSRKWTDLWLFSTGSFGLVPVRTPD
jgi:hypothetical protein